jgi:hypothetical protein
MATISVTSLADGPATAENCPGLNCRLRDAIAAAADGDTIDFSVTGTIVLNSGELSIVKNLTIQGPGAAQLTISGNQVSRVFYISGVTATLSDLTVTKGYVLGNYGGNIFNAGTLTTTNCTISDGYGELHGGGFWNQGTLTINGCTISGNSSTDGGGMFNQGVVTIANTTISGNSSTYTGGGIRTGGGVVTLINCTISGNQGSFAGGVSNPGPDYPVYVRNTIISGNVDRNGWGLPDVSGWETNLGNNLIGGSALLAPLGNYGGATQTHALLPGSPALNAGDNCVLTNTCADNNLGFNLTTDQRGSGFDRQAGGAVDIGAFESGGFTLAISGGNLQSTNTDTDFANPLAVTVSANGLGEPVEGGQVTFTPPESGASATIAGNPATIDSGGTATSGTVTANAMTGRYSVLAGGPGLTSVSFTLSNLFPCSMIGVSPAAGSLPSATVGNSYSQQFTQSGGAGAIIWSMKPSIPGLTLDSNGLLSGVPTTAGAYNFTVVVEDINGCVGQNNYSLVILTGNCPLITLSLPGLPTATVGVSYSATVTPVGGKSPYSFTVSGLPSGLSARTSNSSVTISGTPLQSGTFTIQINVVDNKGCTNIGSNSLKLKISRGTPVITWAIPADIYCGTAIGPKQLNATANTAGTFVYTPPSGTVLSVGTYKLFVDFTPADTANWFTASTSVPLNVVAYPGITLKAPSVTVNSNDRLYRTFTIADMVSSVNDGCGNPISLNNVVIERATSDEPDDAIGFTDGATINDIVIAPNCKSVQLRAERDDKLNGRVYKVTLRVTGTSASAGSKAVFSVLIPPKTGKTIVDSGVALTKVSDCQQ